MPLDPTKYKGTPLEDLDISAVVWSTERAEHIRTRSKRAGNEGDLDIEPEWATEAALDPNRYVRVAGQAEETSSLKVVGYSPSAINGKGAHLKVWIWSDDAETSGVWNGGSASAANDSDIRRYSTRPHEQHRGAQ